MTAICLCQSAPAQTVTHPAVVFISGGQFERRGYHSYVEPAHPSDEITIRTGRSADFAAAGGYILMRSSHELS